MSVCAGAEMFAATGLIDGRRATTHWGDIGRIERSYPAVHWVRGQRYVDDGQFVSTAGILSGIDGSLHMIDRLRGRVAALQVAHALHYDGARFLDDPTMPQFRPAPRDAIVLLNAAYSLRMHESLTPDHGKERLGTKMEYVIGIALALAVSALATAVGFDRDRAFYPVLAIVIASYYGLFAIMGGSPGTLMTESIVITAFVLISILGFKFNLWLVVAALLAHGVFDFIHARLIANPGVPAWWPGFCLTYDIAAAGYLAWILRSRLEATRARSPNAESLKPAGDPAAAP